uniref:Cell surface receptor IPT/TIG domain protein n=1 Tax=Solibacter usitatus (strain Ellin6076) TaxID=234267 RepID=Q01Z88_SOLUE
MRLSLAIFIFSAVAYAQGPSISSLQPPTANAGSPSFTLTVNGSGFVSGSAVKWSGSSLATTFVSDTLMTAAVPSNLLAICGKFPVTVTNPGGAVSNNNTPVVVNPVLNAISPNQLSAGSGGVNVTAFGQGFSSNVVITLNANGGKTNLATNYGSPTTLSAFIPGTAFTGVYPVSIQVTDTSTGAASDAFPITIGYANVTLIRPESVNAGDPDFTLFVGGSGFVPGAQVFWNNTIGLVTQYINSATLSAAVPAATYADPAGGQIGITVKNPGAAATNSLTLIVHPDPRGTTLSSLDPPQAVTGGPSFTLTAIGSRFTTQSVIVWQNTPLPTTFVDSTKLTTLIPASLIAVDASAAITVATPGVTPSGVVRLPIVTASPTVTSISPASVAMGSAAVTITVTGSGFIPASQVVSLPNLTMTTTYVSFTQLTASVPASSLTAAGSYAIRVNSPGGFFSPIPATFTVQAPTPAISKLAPASAAAGGDNFTLTVTGSSFTANAVVNFNNTPLTTTFVSATQLTAVVPASAIATAGAASVTVTNEGQTVSNALSFTVAGTATTIVSLNPASATAGGAAFTLTVTGTGFSAASKVQWNSTALTTTFVSSTQLTAAVPANLIAAAGSVNITVAGAAGPSNSVAFAIGGTGPNVTTAGIVNAASNVPAIAPGALISIYGSNLAAANASAPSLPLTNTLGGTTVNVNGSAIPLLFVSAGQVNAQLPYEIKPGSAKLTVTAGGAESAAVNFDVAATGPGVFTIQQTNHVVAQNLPDFTLNGADHPVLPGQYVTLYVTGQGSVDPPVTTGAGAPSDPLSYPQAPVVVKIGGQPADVQFAGLAPAFVGLLQINVKIPNLPAGEQTVDVSVGPVAAAQTMITVGSK